MRGFRVSRLGSRIGARRGQATTEYMLVIAVLVIAMVYVFWDGLVTPFNTAMEDIGEGAKTVYASGDLAE